jgi:hypothetical protein
MTQNGLLATRSPSDNMKVVYLEAEEKGCKKKENEPNSKAPPGCGICDERHRGCDVRHAYPCDGRHTWCDERHTVPLLFGRR